MQAVPAQMQAPGEARPVGMQMQPMVINGAAPQAMMMSPLSNISKISKCRQTFANFGGFVRGCIDADLYR